MELSNILLLTLLTFPQMTNQMTLSSNFGSNNTTEFRKIKNRDIELKCLLSENHEELNKKATVTWWLRKSCKFPLCLQQKMIKKTDEFEEISACNGVFCGTSLILNDTTAMNGIYMCKIFPYRVNSQVLLQVQLTKSFQVTIDDPNQLPPPDIVEEPNHFSVKSRSQFTLQCKVISSQLPTVKWFKKRENDQPTNFNPEDLKFSQPIKFFENFYEPLTIMGGSNMGLRSNSTFLSKLILNDVIRSSVYVCVAINYHGISYREFFIDVDNGESSQAEDEQFKELMELPERNYELLFVIPLIILISISAVLSTVLYMLIRSKIAVKAGKITK